MLCQPIVVHDDISSLRGDSNTVFPNDLADMVQHLSLNRSSVPVGRVDRVPSELVRLVNKQRVSSLVESLMVRVDLIEPHPLPGLWMQTNSREILPVGQSPILMPLEFVVQSLQILFTCFLGRGHIPLPAVVERVVLVLVEHSVARSQPLKLSNDLRVQLRENSAAVSRRPFTTILCWGLAIQRDIPRAPDSVELIVRLDGIVAMIVTGGTDSVVHNRGGHGTSLNRTQIGGLIL
mmetsp:Transcript_5028/g.11094  ORF Transcript_5028/g.11094 Transcript_5028/m.11094 type:complete len:235 (-) Transcript_5028:493-1197(-)